METSLSGRAHRDSTETRVDEAAIQAIDLDEIHVGVSLTFALELLRSFVSSSSAIADEIRARTVAEALLQDRCHG